MDTLRSVPTARRGFTLLEILIVVAVMAMLAGAAIPVASRALTSAARKATREELVQLGVAAQEYFRDTNVAPRDIRDLERDTGAEGWAGPYVSASAEDPSAAGGDRARDAWSRDYRVRLTGDVLTITSAGSDASLDTDDDVRIQVDFTPIRREETLEELQTINRAVTLYNGLRGADDPLPGAWSAALAKLVQAGFLVEVGAYANDAWGNPYTSASDERSPLVRVVSPSVGGAESANPGAAAKPGPASKKKG